MSADRRDFLRSTPLFLAALLGDSRADSSTVQTVTPHDLAALDFWTQSMGVPHKDIPTAKQISDKAGIRKGPSSSQSFGREPVFLHYDKNNKTFITMKDMPKNYLLEKGDTQVDTQMKRLRLNDSDNTRMSKYTSGAIYFEMQQKAGAAAKGGGASSGLISGISSKDVTSFATSMFSAFTPGGSKKSDGKTGKPTKPTKGGSGATHSKGSSAFLSSSAADQNSAGSAGAPIPLQSTSQAQTLALPNGMGKAAFQAFVKDPHKSAFGYMVSALTSPPGSDATTPVYAQLLTLPLLAVPGLASVRSIVANLQLNGSSQEIILQSPPTDIVTTAEYMGSTENQLPLRAGDYIVIPRDHDTSIGLDEINKYQLWEGFLVPKEVKSELEINSEMMTNALPTLSYLSIGVGVKAIKIGQCAGG